MQLNAAGASEVEAQDAVARRHPHLVLSPLEFLQRLAALVPRPRQHLIRIHGVLAPNAKLGSLVVPQGLVQPEAATEAAAATKCEVKVEIAQGRPGRISWDCLLKRVFDIDMQHCPNCGAGKLKTIAAILDRPVIEKILTHLDLASSPRAPARKPGRHQAGRAASCRQLHTPQAAASGRNGELGPTEPGLCRARRGRVVHGIRVNPEFDATNAFEE